MTAIATLEDGVVYYPKCAKAALGPVNFALHAGERVGLTGDNGSGKSTLVMALTGLRPLTSGRLLHNGKPVVTQRQLTLLRRDIGIVFQNADDQLFLPTVVEDVAFGPLNLGFPPEKAKTSAMETLERLGQADFAHRLTHTLSGGQKRIVALATALAMHPKALVLDEPTNDLDSKGVVRLEGILREENIALVLVSHNHAFLSRLVTRTVHLQAGKIVTPAHALT